MSSKELTFSASNNLGLTDNNTHTLLIEPSDRGERNRYD